MKLQHFRNEKESGMNMSNFLYEILFGVYI